jgi:flagellar motor protein MotB
MNFELVDSVIDSYLQTAKENRPDLSKELHSQQIKDILRVVFKKCYEGHTISILEDPKSLSPSFNVSAAKKAGIVVFALVLALKIQNDGCVNVVIGNGNTIFCSPEGVRIPNNPNNKNTIIPNPEIFTVYFEFGQSSIRNLQKSKINELANYLQQQAERKITVIGYTDSTPGEAETSHSVLSNNRGEAVKAQLVLNGIEAERIQVIAMGHEKPVLNENGTENEVLSRRVEFLFH